MEVGTAWLAWREILNEVLEPFAVMENASPEWLRNPETGRRLTLDLFYPEIRFAVHFTGAQPAKRRRRLSEEEIEAEEHRETIRARVCAEHEVALAVIDLLAPEPWQNLERVYVALGTAIRYLAHADHLPHERKVALLDRLAVARRRVQGLRSRLRQPEDLQVFADKWRDRETRALRAARRSRAASQGPTPKYTVGLPVEHVRFGRGVVVAVEGNGHDQRVTVEFPHAGRRTFLADLVADKLTPLTRSQGQDGSRERK